MGNLTERTAKDPSPLAKRFTNFRQRFDDPIKAGPIIGEGRPRRGHRYILDSHGELPED